MNKVEIDRKSFITVNMRTKNACSKLTLTSGYWWKPQFLCPEIERQRVQSRDLTFFQVNLEFINLKYEFGLEEFEFKHGLGNFWFNF